MNYVAPESMLRNRITPEGLRMLYRVRERIDLRIVELRAIERVDVENARRDDIAYSEEHACANSGQHEVFVVRYAADVRRPIEHAYTKVDVLIESAIGAGIVAAPDAPKVGLLRDRIGGFSDPSKMPCLSWSIPAITCKVGARLAKVDGSVCSGCYALKGTYQFRSTRIAMARRFILLSRALVSPQSRAGFVDAFVAALQSTEHSGFFRFHDSGDVQSLEHFGMICDIARTLPEMRFWIPTREAGIIRAFQFAGGTIPENLTVRVSAPMVDVTVRPLSGCVTSAVYSAREFGTGPRGRRHALPVIGKVDISGVVANACVAPIQAGHCGACRSCWDRSTETVAYLKH